MIPPPRSHCISCEADSAQVDYIVGSHEEIENTFALFLLVLRGTLLTLPTCHVTQYHGAMAYDEMRFILHSIFCPNSIFCPYFTQHFLS